jgi:hypothetical protein
MPLEYTNAEREHDIAMLARTYEVRQKLRPATKAQPVVVEVKPRFHAPVQPKADPAPRKELPRHPSDMVRYKWPLSYPALDGPGNPNKPKYVPVQIIAQVAEDAGLSVDDLRSGSRIARIVRPRQFAMWLIKQRIPEKSLPQIGVAFGGRDHTTALNAIRKIDRLIREGVIDPANPLPWFNAAPAAARKKRRT